MKKFISGFIAGALLFGGTAAVAAQPNLIGQKVQAIFSVEKGGKKIADAVVVNGSTYAPVRALAEVTGTELRVEGKTIKMLDKQEAPIAATDEVIPLTVQISGKKAQLLAAQQNLDGAKSGKQGWEDMLKQLDPDTEYGRAIMKNIADCDKQIAEAQTELSRIEAELAALQDQQ